MLSTLWLAFSFLGCASATGSFVVWDERQRSAIVKLDTPGYPLWTIPDGAEVPAREKDAEDFYQEIQGRSAVLLNITLGHNNKTVYVNKEMVIPFKDYNRPPQIRAYQVPADISKDQIYRLKEEGLLDRKADDMTHVQRYLQLDYDRLVQGNPEQGPWINAAPDLYFRIMGIGAHTRNDVLEDTKQDIMHVKMIDTNHGMSDSPKVSWILTDVNFLKPDENTYYRGVPVVELAAEKKECVWTSWRCPDFKLFEDGAPYYRFIWRDRFDKYGRVGSGRRAAVKKLWVLIELWDTAGSAMLLSFGILMSIAMGTWGTAAFVKWWAPIRDVKRKRDLARRLDEEEMLIEAIVDEVEDGEEKPIEADTDKPLPPVPQTEQDVDDLIDLGSEFETKV